MYHLVSCGSGTNPSARATAKYMSSGSISAADIVLFGEVHGTFAKLFMDQVGRILLCKTE